MFPAKLLILINFTIASASKIHIYNSCGAKVHLKSPVVCHVEVVRLITNVVLTENPHGPTTTFSDFIIDTGGRSSAGYSIKYGNPPEGPAWTPQTNPIDDTVYQQLFGDNGYEVHMKFYSINFTVGDENEPTATGLIFASIIKENFEQPQFDRQSGWIGLDKHTKEPEVWPLEYRYLVKIYDQLPQKLFAIWLAGNGKRDGYLSLGNPLPNCFDPATSIKVPTVDAHHTWTIEGSVKISIETSTTPNIINYHSFQLKQNPGLPGDGWNVFPIIATTESLFRPGIKILLDTGTPKILVSNKMADFIEEKLSKLIPGGQFDIANQHNFDKNYKCHLPTFNFFFSDTDGNSKKFVVTPDDYILQVSHTEINVQELGKMAQTSFMILGLPFIRKFYTEYHIGQKTDPNGEAILIAEKKLHC